MIPCKACGQTISSQAKACPSCGQPIVHAGPAFTRAGVNMIKGGCAVAVLAIFIFAVIAIVVAH